MAIKNLTAAEIELVIFALNNFGGGGPVASAETVKYFTASHIRDCVSLALKADVTDEAKALATAILATLKAQTGGTDD